MRRTAAEIERDYICPYPECGKLYGSEGSLNLHIKIKHNGGNKTEREKMAVSIFVSFILSLEIGFDSLSKWQPRVRVGDPGPQSASGSSQQGNQEICRRCWLHH